MEQGLAVAVIAQVNAVVDPVAVGVELADVQAAWLEVAWIVCAQIGVIVEQLLVAASLAGEGLIRIF